MILSSTIILLVLSPPPTPTPPPPLKPIHLGSPPIPTHVHDSLAGLQCVLRGLSSSAASTTLSSQSSSPGPLSLSLPLSFSVLQTHTSWHSSSTRPSLNLQRIQRINKHTAPGIIVALIVSETLPQKHPLQDRTRSPAPKERIIFSNSEGYTSITPLDPPIDDPREKPQHPAIHGKTPSAPFNCSCRAIQHSNLRIRKVRKSAKQAVHRVPKGPNRQDSHPTLHRCHPLSFGASRGPPVALFALRDPKTIPLERLHLDRATLPLSHLAVAAAEDEFTIGGRAAAWRPGSQ